MRLFDGLLTRRRQLPRYTDVPEGARRRLDRACRELTQAEDRMAARLGIAAPPRLLLVDEEEAVVITPDERKDISAVAARRQD